MKILVSIPDRLFESAERVAKRLGITRSDLYARAVAAWVRSDGAGVTQSLNAAYEMNPVTLDSTLHALPARVVEREEW